MAASRPRQSSSSWHCSSKPDTCGSDVQSEVLWTIRAPCRNVTFAFGHRTGSRICPGTRYRGNALWNPTNGTLREQTHVVRDSKGI